MKFKLKLAANLDAKSIEEIALQDERVIQQLNGNNPKKIIVVPKKIINIVL